MTIALLARWARVLCWGAGVAVLTWVEPAALAVLPVLGLLSALPLAWPGMAAGVIAVIGDLMGLFFVAIRTAAPVTISGVVSVVLVGAAAVRGGPQVGAVGGVLAGIMLLAYSRLLLFGGVPVHPDILVVGALAAVGGGIGWWYQRWQRTGQLALASLRAAYPRDLPIPLWWFEGERLVAATAAATRLAADPRTLLDLPPLWSLRGRAVSGETRRGERTFAWGIWRPDDAGDPRRTPAVVMVADLSALADDGRDTLQRLVGDLAHEVQNPLAVLRSALEMLLEGSLDPADRITLLARSREAVQQMERTIQLASSLGRLSAGTTAPMEWETLCATLHATVAPFDVRLTCEGLALDGAWIDPEGVQRILVNLVRNAASAAGAGGWVRVQARRADGTLTLQVSDSGPGLPDGALPLDQPRVRRSTTGGEGRGLALVSHTVALLGGVMDYTPPHEGGSTSFTVRLPDVVGRGLLE